MRLVSSMFIKILDIQEDEIKQFNTCIITRSHFECFALNICVFVWLAFWVLVSYTRWWFQTLFPNSTSFGVFRDSKGFGAELPSADPPWAARRFHQGFTKVLQVSLCLWFSGAKGSVEGSPITSLNLSPSSSTLFCIFHQQRWLWCLLGPKLTRLSSWALCSKWLSQHKSFFGVFQFLTLVSQSPALFGANGCCFRKGSVEGSANYSLHLSLRLLLHKSSLEGSSNCALHLSPNLLGSKLCELLTCLTHTKIQSTENDPSCRCCWGSFGKMIQFDLGIFVQICWFNHGVVSELFQSNLLEHHLDFF